jgi:hypothetical protein
MSYLLFMTNFYLWNYIFESLILIVKNIKGSHIFYIIHIIGFNLYGLYLHSSKLIIFLSIDSFFWVQTKSNDQKYL